MSLIFHLEVRAGEKLSAEYEEIIAGVMIHFVGTNDEFQLSTKIRKSQVASISKEVKNYCYYILCSFTRE